MQADIQCQFWGIYNLNPAVKKAYELRPKVPVSRASVASQIVNPTAKEMYQLHSKISASCV
jgi:hypothetical protein